MDDFAFFIFFTFKGHLLCSLILNTLPVTPELIQPCLSFLVVCSSQAGSISSLPTLLVRP
jgi:hypothetical protein